MKWLGVECEIRTKTKFPTGPNGQDLPSVVEITGCQIWGDGDIEQSIAMVEATLAPCQPRAIEDMLAELSVLTVPRQTSGFNAGMMVSVYTERLRAYPVDVVRSALLGRTWQWFPTWHELLPVCEELIAPRRAILAGLRKGPPKPEPPRRQATEAEKRRAQELVDKAYPEISAKWRKDAVEQAMAGDCMTGEPDAELGATDQSEETS